MKKSRKEQIADLQRKRTEIATKAAEDDKKVADRLRELQKQDSKAERRRQNRCKFVVGAWVLDAVKNNTEISLAWYNDKVTGLTRNDQRALFNLDSPGTGRCASTTGYSGRRRIRLKKNP